MNWDAIGAIGEALSAIGLFFVLLQVRHARAEVRRSVSQNRAEATRQQVMALATNERLAGIEAKARAALGGQMDPVIHLFMERAGLTEEDATSLFYNYYGQWQIRTQLIPHAGELPRSERLAFETNLRNAYGGRMQGSRLWYEGLKDGLDSDAVRYVDKLLA